MRPTLCFGAGRNAFLVGKGKVVHFVPIGSTYEEGIVFRLGDSLVEVVVPCDDHTVDDILMTIEGLVPLELVTEAVVPLDGELSVQDTNSIISRLREMGFAVSPTIQGAKTSLEAHSERHLSIAVP